MKFNKIALAAAFGLFSMNALADGIIATLDANTTNISAKDDLTVTLTLTNDEQRNIKLLKWYTPEEGITDALFSVVQNGEKIHYLGAHIKRPAPAEQDYIKLAPGESVKYEVELSGLYELTQTGSYEIQYHVENVDLMRGQSKLGQKLAPMPDEIQSNTINLWIEGRESVSTIVPAQDFSILAKTPNYTGGCSNSEKSSIQSALTAAENMADNAVNYLNNSSNYYNDRYDTWFGSYTSTRWNNVRENFESIQDAISNKTLTFDCSCNQGYFAYVYPNSPYKVYLCNAFWSANTTGTDSKAGTIIHELSHFNVVAGTDDLAYGQSAAKRLSPSRAVRNADNHEYFAENTPYQN